MRDNQIVELSWDGGIERFRFLMTFEFEDVRYVALELLEEEGEVAVFKVDHDEEGIEVFNTIQDENEAKRIWVYFVSLWETENDEFSS